MAMTVVNGKMLYFPNLGDIVKHPVTGVEGIVMTGCSDQKDEVKVEYYDGHYEWHKPHELKPYKMKYGNKHFTPEEYWEYLDGDIPEEYWGYIKGK